MTHIIITVYIDFKNRNKQKFISWPTLFLFEVACSLIVLDCTLRKIQQNIKVGGAKLQRTVQYISADIRYTARATYSMVLSTFDICTNLL